MRLGVTKKALCSEARIKPEMFSYVLKRARLGLSLPDECVAKIWRALQKMEKK